MTKFRLNIFLTRLIIIGLLLVVVALFAKPATKKLIQRNLVQSTGWNWEFEFKTLDFVAGKIELADLKITPANDPGGRPIIADKAEIEVESWGVWDGRPVLANVRIVSARSAGLDRIVALDMQHVWPASANARPLTRQKMATQATRTWLDGSMIKRSEPVNFTSPDVAKKMLAEWEPELKLQANSIHSTAKRLVLLDQSLATKSDNPLRTALFREQTTSEIKQLESGLDELRSNFQALVRRRDDELAKLETAKAADLKTIQQSPSEAGFDSRDELADLALVGFNYDEFTSRLVKWADSICVSTLPIPGSTEESDGGRRVVFHGSTPHANLVIRKLELDGACKVNQKHLEFFLTLENLTDRIELQKDPTRMTLRAQGPQHFLVTGEFTGSRSGSISVSCPSCTIGPIQLGDGAELDLLAAEGAVAFDAKIELDDAGARGAVHIEHSFSGIDFRTIHRLLGSQLNLEGIRSEFLQIENFSSVVAFEGSRESVATRLIEGPGNILNNIIRRNVAQSSSADAEQALAAIESVCQDAQTRIDGTIQELAGELNQLASSAEALEAKARKYIEGEGAIRFR